MQMLSIIRHGVRRTRAITLCFVCLLAAGGASAMQNEPRDFQGVPWGAPLEEHKQGLSLLTGDDQMAHYRRASDAAAYANVAAWRISYRFYKNRFSGGIVVIVGASNLKSMLEYLTQTYGPPAAVNPRHRVYTWTGEHAGIGVSCDISISCYVEFYGKEMRELELAEQGEVPGTGKRDD
jgi:hypothetical protein